MKRLLIALVLLAATAFGQSVGTVFFQASYTQSAGTVAAPTFNNGTGSYSGSATVTISDSTDSASIFYCTAVGSDCTPGTGYTVPVVISVTNTHLCANATKSGYTTSATTCVTYTITASTPAPAFVQQCNQYQSWGTNVSCDLNTVGTGNLILVVVVTTNAFTPSSVTDSNGSVSASIVSSTSAGLSKKINLYSVSNTSSGTHTITANISSSSNMWISAVEYSGASTTSPIDGFASLDCESTCPTTVTTGTINTTQSNELIFAYGRVAVGVTINAGSGFTSRTTNTSGSGVPMMEDKATTTAGSYVGEWGNPLPGIVMGVAVAVKRP